MAARSRYAPTPPWIVVTTMPAAARPPQGGASALLTMYGIDGAQHAETRRRWDAWWRENLGEVSILP